MFLVDHDMTTWISEREPYKKVKVVLSNYFTIPSFQCNKPEVWLYLFHFVKRKRERNRLTDNAPCTGRPLVDCPDQCSHVEDLRDAQSFISKLWQEGSAKVWGLAHWVIRAHRGLHNGVSHVHDHFCQTKFSLLPYGA